MTILDQAVQDFHRVYDPETSLQQAKDVSRHERSSEGFLSRTLVYGEVDVQAFLELLESLPKRSPDDNRHDQVFLDVGAGAGKAVVAAALSRRFRRCVGIEILYGLFCLSQSAAAVARPLLDAGVSLEFLYDDATRVRGNGTWHDADVVFINSTCFDETLMAKVAARAREVRNPNARFLTVSRRLPAESFDVLETRTLEQSWGPSTIFIQQRRKDGEGGPEDDNLSLRLPSPPSSS